MTIVNTWFTGIALVVATLSGPHLVLAQQTCPRPVALFESVKNSVQLVQVSTQAQPPVVRQTAVCAGDTIRVGDNSRAVILVLASNTPLVLDQNSELVITESSDRTEALIDLLRGAMLFITRARRSFQIRTPFVNAAIEGTEFVVRVQAERTVITVFEGAVRASNPLGTLLVGPGQQAVAVQGQPPQLELPVRPRDAVQWALYYEPVLPSDSFEQLELVPLAQRGADYYVRHAALLLGAGQLEEARSNLEQSRQLDPSNTGAYALRAIIAIALNDKVEALANGRAAALGDPQSSSARLALSYALQANFDLESALQVAMQALELRPDDGFAWTRISELRLALDDIGGALEAAREATSVAPQFARAHTMLGFALLAQLKLSEARASFERAILVEPDGPLSRFGLGLVEIRQGDLSTGRRDFEIAAALNPESSLIRSYLGKAYVDEKRNVLAAESLALAKELDQFDPTPWFYDAIQKQVLNRPVEALNDLQRSIELNNNRAVYRSRFLLDADLAVRGARLGRIYRDLGFERLALLEGWKSLASDPANHSVHRLLADTYLALPRHGIARDSELLQSQLLQPLNVNPVQPRLADNGLSFLDDTAVSRVGFNEFARLFAANQFRFLADAVLGDQGTRTDNVVASGIRNRLSFSAGQFHYESEGIRANNDLRLNIYDAFLQMDFSELSSAQVEVRTSTSRSGDRRLLFNPETFLTTNRNIADTTSVRLGFRQHVARDTVLIASYVHSVLDTNLNTGTGVVRDTNNDADFGETRLLHKWNRLNISTGGGYYEGGTVSTITFRNVRGAPADSVTRHVNGYVYASISLPDNFTVVTGLSGDHFDGGLLDRRQANPKLGFVWDIRPRTSLRAAAFRSLKRTLISSQTIEPTQIAGFNQFFDDPNSTDAWRYGMAMDQKVTSRVNVGTEVSMRELVVPSVAAATGLATDTERREKSASTYLYASIRKSITLASEYRFEKLNRDALGRNEGLLADSVTHKISGEARMFHPSGLFGRLRLTFVDEHGHFQGAMALVIPGADRFTNVDVLLGYRLPRQFGVTAIDVRNLLNNSFQFQDSSPEDSRIQPRRSVTARWTLSL